MDIVEVQFIEDTQSIHTGNEFYAAGSKAHFYANQAGVLVAQGQAVIYKKQLPAEGDNILPPTPDYSKMTVKQLKALAHERGIAVSGKRKANLIAALED